MAHTLQKGDNTYQQGCSHIQQRDGCYSPGIESQQTLLWPVSRNEFVYSQRQAHIQYVCQSLSHVGSYVHSMRLDR
jgi:hypothetical protein